MSRKEMFELLFHDLAPNEFVDVRLIGNGPPRQKFCQRYEEIEAICKEAISSKLNAFWGIGVRDSRNGKKEAVSRLTTIWADIDAKRFNGDKSAILKQIEELPWRPSVLVDSGGGYHAYWLLKSPVGRDSIQKAEAAMKAIQLRLKTDAVHDASRILRIPDTYNFKADYPEPREVKTFWLQPSLRYELDAFQPPPLPSGPSSTSYDLPPLDSRIAEAVLPYWSKGQRDNLTLALSGTLAKGKWPQARAEKIIESIAIDAEDEELEARLHVCRNTYKRAESGQAVMGVSGLSSFIPATVIQMIQEAMSPKKEAPPENWLISAPDLLKTAFPAEQWLIEELWSESACGIIGGPPKTGKTWVGLDMAISIATGAKVFGRYSVPKPGPAIYIAGEDQKRYLKPRLQALLAAKGLSGTSLTNLHIATERFILDQDDWKETIAKTCKALRPRAIFLDPFIRMHTADENSSQQLTAVLGYLRDLQQKNDCSVIVVHHFRKPRGPGLRSNPEFELRGSGDLFGWVDSCIYLQPFKAEPTPIIQVEGDHRNAPPLGQFHLSMEITQEKALLSVCQSLVASSGEDEMSNRISEFLSEQTDRKATRQQIMDSVIGKLETKAKVLKLLVEQGVLQKSTEMLKSKNNSVRPQVVFTLSPEEPSQDSLGDQLPASLS